MYSVVPVIDYSNAIADINAQMADISIKFDSLIGHVYVFMLGLFLFMLCTSLYKVVREFF